MARWEVFGLVGEPFEVLRWLKGRGRWEGFGEGGPRRHPWVEGCLVEGDDGLEHSSFSIDLS